MARQRRADGAALLPARPGQAAGQDSGPQSQRLHAGHAFELIAALFQSYVMPAEPAARIYRALGAIKGVTADEGHRARGE
jgi:hypothetical protein